MRNIVLIPNMTKQGSLDALKAVLSLLVRFDCHVYLEEKLQESVGDVRVQYYTEPPSTCDLVLVIGGDGSVLDAVDVALMTNAPILGINLGKLGYLAEVESNNISVLENLFHGAYFTEERMMLDVVLHAKDGTVTPIAKPAFNEVSITHDSILGIADILLVDTNADKIAYRCDGLLVATPSGSTAYSFSAGGPVINANVECICVTPICPHSFFRQSILFSSEDVLCISNNSSGEDALYICADARPVATLLRGDTIEIRQSKRTLKMISFDQHSTFQILRKKMEQMEATDC